MCVVIQELLHCIGLWDNSMLDSGALSLKLEPWNLEACMPSVDCSCVRPYAWHGKDVIVRIVPTILF